MKRSCDLFPTIVTTTERAFVLAFPRSLSSLTTRFVPRSCASSSASSNITTRLPLAANPCSWWTMSFSTATVGSVWTVSASWLVRPKHEFVRVIVVLGNLISEGQAYTNDVLKNPQADVKLVAPIHKQTGVREEDGRGRQTGYLSIRICTLAKV